MQCNASSSLHLAVQLTLDRPNLCLLLWFIEVYVHLGCWVSHKDMHSWLEAETAKTAKTQDLRGMQVRLLC